MKDLKSTVDFLNSLAQRIDKEAEETTETTTPEAGQGATGAEVTDLVETGVRDPEKAKKTAEPSANKDGSPKKDAGDAPADIPTTGPMEASPEAKEAARKAIDFDKLAEACVLGIDLLHADAADKEAEREVEAELEQYIQKGRAYREVLLEEFEKMAEVLEEQVPGFKTQFETLGGGEALLQKLAEEMPSAIAPEELAGEAEDYETANAMDQDAAMLDELGVDPEELAKAQEEIEALLAEGVPEEAIIEALTEQLQGEGEEPMPEEPMAEEPAAEEPMPEEPAAEEPMTEEPLEEMDAGKEAELRDAWTAVKAGIRKRVGL